MNFLIFLAAVSAIYYFLTKLVSSDFLSKIKKAGFNQDDLKFWLEGKRTSKDLIKIVIDHDLKPSEIQKFINKK